MTAGHEHALGLLDHRRDSMARRRPGLLAQLRVGVGVGHATATTSATCARRPATRGWRRPPGCRSRCSGRRPRALVGQRHRQRAATSVVEHVRDVGRPARLGAHVVDPQQHPPRPASMQGRRPPGTAARRPPGTSRRSGDVNGRSSRISVIEVASAPGMPGRDAGDVSQHLGQASDRPGPRGSAREPILHAASALPDRRIVPPSAGGPDRSGWTPTENRSGRPRSRREGRRWLMSRRRRQHAWPSVPVPSVPGDVWHWQLEAMHVVSRVRADLRARIAHPSVSSASTDDARDGLLWCSRSWPRTRCGTAVATSARWSWPALRLVARPQRRGPDRRRYPAVDRDPRWAAWVCTWWPSSPWSTAGSPARPQARVGPAALRAARAASPANGCPSRAPRNCPGTN